MEDRRRPRTTWMAVLAAALAACSTDKTSTPTSPNIAGPIAGVDITAPRPLVPLSGATVLAEGQPVTLVVDNATTNGVRPLSYTFQVGTDAGFGTLAFSAEGVPPGGDGRTGVTVSTLAPGRTYHWRARALDGANTGPFSAPRHFEYREPVVIQPPEAIEPVAGVRTSSRQPTLRTRNAARTGPAGEVSYEFHVSDDASFGGVVFVLTSGEQPTSTQVTVNVQLEQNRTYYWRVRAREASTTGPWSATNAFMTPLPVTTPPPPPTTTPPGIPPPPQGTGIPSSSEGTAMVAFVVADLQARGISILGDCGAFEVTKRVAWNFRDRGAGLERKTGGRRCEDASIDIVFFNDGTSVDILVGAGIDNGPAWQVHPTFEGWQLSWIPPYNPDGLSAASEDADGRDEAIGIAGVVVERGSDPHAVALGQPGAPMGEDPEFVEQCAGNRDVGVSCLPAMQAEGGDRARRHPGRPSSAAPARRSARRPRSHRCREAVRSPQFLSPATTARSCCCSG